AGGSLAGRRPRRGAELVERAVAPRGGPRLPPPPQREVGVRVTRLLRDKLLGGAAGLGQPPRGELGVGIDACGILQRQEDQQREHSALRPCPASSGSSPRGIFARRA